METLYFVAGLVLSFVNSSISFIIHINTNSLLALFTGLLVVDGAIQAIRLRQTVELTKDVAEAALKNATAAELAIKTNRPYLLPVGIFFGSTSKVFDSGVKWQSRHDRTEIRVPAPVVAFKNYGRSPALVKSAVASFEPYDCIDDQIGLHNSHERLAPGELFNETNTLDRFIPEGGNFSITAYTKLTQGWTITAEQFEQMGALEWTLVAYGRIEYDEAFGSQASHVTDFCWVVKIDFEKNLNNTIRLLWADGPEDHNHYT